MGCIDRINTSVKSNSSRRAFLALLAGMPALASAQTQYPTREIRLVVPWAPGGSVDITARLIARLAEEQGLRMVVDNMPGAKGAIGLQKVAASAPDGYTVGIATTSQLALVAQGLAKTGNDQFTYLHQVSVEPFLLLVPRNGPAQSLPAFLRMVRDKPGKVSLGTAGANNLPRILAAATARSQGVAHVPVACKGSAKVLIDLAGGQIDAAILKPSEAKSYLDAGLIHAIAVYGGKRLPSLPGVPTFAEHKIDVYPDGQLIQMSWLVGPAGLPNDVAAVLIHAAGKAMKSESFVRFAQENSFDAGTTSGQDLKRQVDSMQATLDKVAPKIFKKE